MGVRTIKKVSLGNKKVVKGNSKPKKYSIQQHKLNKNVLLQETWSIKVHSLANLIVSSFKYQTILEKVEIFKGSSWI